MVNHVQAEHSFQALACKDRGNHLFKTGQYTDAEKSYTEAIMYDPSNPVLYTNRAMVNLKLSLFDHVIKDAEVAIRLVPNNMKAIFLLAQAQLATNSFTDALVSAKKARELCLEGLYLGQRDGNSIGPITDLVLKCKKVCWEAQELENQRKRNRVLDEILCLLEERRDKEIESLRRTGDDNIDEIKIVEHKCHDLSEELRRICEMASGEKKREVPDWCIDHITFSVMLDPVVTKTGQSYDRASILEHLKRSRTDPLTREPLHAKDLRPNIALREACQEFLQENGWAVDW